MIKIAIPSYRRSNELLNKTLNTLHEGGISKNQIFIFLANTHELAVYSEKIPQGLYHQMIIGEKGIAKQRNFIRHYFKPGDRVVSIDDDIKEVCMLVGDKLERVNDLNLFFHNAFHNLEKHNLSLWGIYPCANPFFMKSKKETTTDLKFIIGCLHGFIVREGNEVLTNPKAEGKEDYEMSILHYLRDGGVFRYNNMTVKTKFNAKGGLGEHRFNMNERAANYLKDEYPDYFTIFHRKNGMTEVRLRERKSTNN